MKELYYLDPNNLYIIGPLLKEKLNFLHIRHYYKDISDWIQSTALL